MTDETQDAAVRAFRHELEDNGGFEVGVRAMLVETFDKAYGEGVAEGIRQAREAVLSANRKFVGADGFDAIRAIDALKP